MLIGCAPGTFLGGGLQTCRKIVDDGWIGTPVAAVAFMTRHGYEAWHEAAEGFYRRPGRRPPSRHRPVRDHRARLALLGPRRRVCGSASTRFPEREVRFGPLPGRRLPVEVSTHVAGTIEFAADAFATALVRWDMWVTHLPYVEVH